METEELDKEVEARETIIGLQPPEVSIRLKLGCSSPGRAEIVYCSLLLSKRGDIPDG